MQAGQFPRPSVPAFRVGEGATSRDALQLYNIHSISTRISYPEKMSDGSFYFRGRPRDKSTGEKGTATRWRIRNPVPSVTRLRTMGAVEDL